MIDLIQNILVFVAVGIALGFLLRKFIWKAKPSPSKSCGKDDCGCH